MKKFCGGFDEGFKSHAIEVIKTPIAAQSQLAHGGQSGSTRRECLDWLLIVNCKHLERVLPEWTEHYKPSSPASGD